MTNSEQGERLPLWRRLLVSPPLIWGAFTVVLCLHLWWLFVSKDPVIVQRFGAFVIFIGILVAARPYLRRGPEEAVRSALPRDPRNFSMGADAGAKRRELVAKLTPEILKDVQAERVWGVATILFGTIINGYGDIVAKWLLDLV
ncbi:hypothetical protein V5F59_16030 [Xanthobacter autotrophicus DSM 431]|uniref:hypothetical protein n=1 Tax=Xanthobacter nonsaccharivorans TaxID=3119912 RepID=UPI0037292FC2